VQEGILQIGKAVYNKSDFLSNIVEEIDIVDKKGNPKYIIQIDFDTKERKVNINLYGEARESSAKELLWIGTADGPSSPQWYTTGNRPTYLISQTIPNLINMNIPDLSEELKRILDTFFYDMGEQRGTKERYRYVIDLGKISIKLKSNDEIYKESKQDARKAIQLAEKELSNFIKIKYNIKPNEVALYFISLNGKPLSNRREYRDRVEEKKLKAYEKGEEGVCSICGIEEGLTSDTSKLKLKFYTTTNLNFPSRFSKANYSKNMLLCKNCMLYLMTGERFIKDNLSTNLGNLQVYLIPHFLYDTNINREEMESISDKLLETFNASKKVESLINLEGQIWNILELNNEENYYLINILFYKSSQQAVKVQKLIKDIHPSRFKILINNSFNLLKLFKDLISNKFSMPFGLETLYYLIPIKLKQNEVKEYRKLLSMYDAIFKQLKIDRDVIIKSQIQMIEVHYFEKYNQYNIRRNTIHNAMIQSNMLLKFLENIGCLEEGIGMDTSKLNVDEDIKRYIEEMEYSEEQTAMFLLGYLIGKVGNKQYSDRDGKKPILNKLNFNGMDIAKVKRISSEIVNKLRQNKILKYNEIIYFDHKQLFDKNIENWNLNKHDNLYYILSGYSFATAKSIYKEGGKVNEQ